MYKRLSNPLKSNSFFLFGARGTGKTTLVRALFAGDVTLHIDLLDPSEERAFSLNPGLLKERIRGQESGPEYVLIDEVQKVPALLDVVHSLIESGGPIFVLTGSSARKLKAGGGNLLAGRAFFYELFPLTHLEMGRDFDLNLVLNWGSLPRVCSFKTDEERFEFLTAYAHIYLKEEILAEQMVRNLLPFRKFLVIAAQQNGKICNFTKIAREVGADFNTVKKYFQILEDTLLGFFLEPYHESVRKRQKQSPSFYFFDLGVARALSETLDVRVKPQTSFYGDAFEVFVITEIFRLNRYFKTGFQLCSFLTQDGAEIDLVLQKTGRPPILIEIKSTTSVSAIDDLRHLEKLLPDFSKGTEAFCLSQELEPRKVGDIQLLHWQDGIRRIFKDKMGVTTIE
jgi:predicted AAA+ superfamily ATPase